MIKTNILIALFLINNQSFAQTLTFDETVSYIKDKLQCCVTNKSSFSAKRNGAVTIKNLEGEFTLNLFDLYSRLDHADNTIRTEKGFAINKSSDNLFYIVFHTSETEGFYIGNFYLEKEADRTYNALLHLRDLCVKPQDPFD